MRLWGALAGETAVLAALANGTFPRTLQKKSFRRRSPPREKWIAHLCFVIATFLTSLCSPLPPMRAGSATEQNIGLTGPW